MRPYYFGEAVGGPLDHGRSLSKPRRGDDSDDNLIEVSVIVDTRNPNGVGRAGMGERHEDNQNEEKAEGTRTSSPIADTSNHARQEHGCLPPSATVEEVVRE